MEWTHLACLLAGTFVGSFLMTVWRNERRYQRDERSRRAFEKAAHRGIIDLNLLYPPATSSRPAETRQLLNDRMH